MRWKFYIITFCSAFIISACTSVPRDDATKLVQAGTNTTDLLHKEIDQYVVELNSDIKFEAFNQMYVNCMSNNATIPKDCNSVTASKIVNDLNSIYEQEMELALVIKKRDDAIKSLGKAYSVFEKEVNWKAKDDFSSATKDAQVSINNFVKILNDKSENQKDANIGVIPYLVGNIAEQRQKNRIMNDSIQLKNATKTLSAALINEKKLYLELRKNLIKRRVVTNTYMLDAGLVNITEALTPISRELGVTLQSDVDKKVASSLQVKLSTEAIIKASLNEKISINEYKLTKSIDALNDLIKMHEEFEKGKPVSMSSINATLDDLILLLKK